MRSINYSRHKFTILTTCLAVIFIFPYTLRHKRPALEIYPSVNLPSGAALVRMDCVTYKSFNTALFGIKENEAILVDSKKFFDPIPRQYSGAIINNFFGLEPISKNHILFKPDIIFTEKNRFSTENIEETKSWIRKKMIDQDFSDSIIIMRKTEIEYNTLLKSKISETIIDEKIIRLR